LAAPEMGGTMYLYHALEQAARGHDKLVED
jgi:hypothetical protein